MHVPIHAVAYAFGPSILELLVGFTVLVTLLVLMGLVFPQIGSARDARRFPPPGQMIDVGGNQLHIFCLGEGTPTMVMDSGFPTASLSWSFVRPEVTKFTNTCSYDRAGLDWSDAGPLPRTNGQFHRFRPWRYVRERVVRRDDLDYVAVISVTEWNENEL